ncbi:MAG: LPS export ABC transporter periplasmic protein LptC [Gammaproteobacteria bacterium]|nr:LPS export ABC transporter periplasmic protein LptC [Gammaproteobacteria bacterium]
MLAGLSWWWMDGETEQPLAVTERSRDDPDYYLQRFTTTVMSAQGEPRYRISARSMHHYPETDTALLEGPQLVIYRQQGAPWHVDAEHGQVLNGGDMVLLSGVVSMRREASGAESDIRIDGRDLRLWPDREYMESDSPVVIYSASSVLRGVGLRANMKYGQLKILSQVRGYYEPLH